LAETKLLYGTVKLSSDKSVVIQTDQGEATATVTSATKSYRGRATVPTAAFRSGEKVRVRLKTDDKGAVLKEIMDATSEAWLDRIRHEYIRGSVVEKDVNTITFRLDDDSVHRYKVTASSKIEKNGTKAAITDVAPNSDFWVKGRGLSSLETQLVHATDREPIETKPSTTSKKSSNSSTKRSTPLPSVTTVEGKVEMLLTSQGRVDIRSNNTTIHVYCAARTRYTIGGEPGTWRDLVIGIPVVVQCYTDQLGRLVASKIVIP
jgi:hypothetical protein